MEQTENTIAMLDLMPCPAFCVEHGVIVHVNPAAASYPLAPGMQITDLLETGVQEYATQEDGELYLCLNVAAQKLGAAVTRIDATDIFVLDQDHNKSELQALALAAQNLRTPLADIMAIADRLPDTTDIPEDTSAKLNRGLYQMLRIVSNMSDAYLYSHALNQEMSSRNIPAIFDELFEKITALAEHAGIHVSFTGLSEVVFGLVDAQQLERAVENLMANAIKFTPRGGSVAAKLTRKGSMLYLTIQDGGQGFSENARHNFYQRYRRQPSLEDSRNGIGLGLVLVRAIATAHGGTVLVQQGIGQSTKLTMTIAIRQSSETIVRSPVFLIDYTGGRDHTLVELSETLPSDLYR